MVGLCGAGARGDATKWTKRPVLVDGVLRKGFDDATCCEVGMLTVIYDIYGLYGFNF